MLLIGYHGTNEDCAPSILDKGFIPSKGSNHWYGEGVYFFINGINCVEIEKLAEYWAKDQAFDNKNKLLKYNRFAVIEAEITCDDERVVDLRLDETAKKVNAIREKIKRFCIKQRKKMDDNKVWEYMVKSFLIKAIIDNTYIKFREERVQRIGSHINNCTILSVLDCSIIDKNSIKTKIVGDIKNGKISY